MKRPPSTEERPIYVHRDGASYGPYSMADAFNHMKGGALNVDDLAFREGDSEMFPLQDVLFSADRGSESRIKLFGVTGVEKCTTYASFSSSERRTLFTILGAFLAPFLTLVAIWALAPTYYFNLVIGCLICLGGLALLIFSMRLFWQGEIGGWGLLILTFLIAGFVNFVSLPYAPELDLSNRSPSETAKIKVERDFAQNKAYEALLQNEPEKAQGWMQDVRKLDEKLERTR